MEDSKLVGMAEAIARIEVTVNEIATIKQDVDCLKSDKSFVKGWLACITVIYGLILTALGLIK